MAYKWKDMAELLWLVQDCPDDARPDRSLYDADKISPAALALLYVGSLSQYFGASEYGGGRLNYENGWYFHSDTGESGPEPSPLHALMAAGHAGQFNHGKRAGL